MGTFACSSGTHLRFADPHNSDTADKEQVATAAPWTCTWAAPALAVMHLLYARFWTKALHDLGYVRLSSRSETAEPRHDSGAGREGEDVEEQRQRDHA
jgi:leucyl-tRNA synthetase